MTRHAWRSILVLLGAGCTSSRAPSPNPTVPIPQAQPEVVDGSPWSFAYRSDTLSYHINRSAAIETQTDSGTRREIATNNTHEAVSLAVSGDTVRYTASVDTFSTTTQGLIGTMQPPTLPLQISGVLDTNPPSDSSPPVQSCDPVLSSLQSDIRNLLISFPANISVGSSWRDSTTTAVCYGTVPMNAMVVRRFTVVGKTSYDGTPTIALQRRDSVTAHGEGRQQQHRVVVDAGGSGSAMYYLSPETSSLLHLTTSQDLEFLIQLSGRTSRFRESAKQEYSLVH